MADTCCWANSVCILPSQTTHCGLSLYLKKFNGYGVLKHHKLQSIFTNSQIKLSLSHFVNKNKGCYQGLYSLRKLYVDQVTQFTEMKNWPKEYWSVTIQGARLCSRHVLHFCFDYRYFFSTSKS